VRRERLRDDVEATAQSGRPPTPLRWGVGGRRRGVVRAMRRAIDGAGDIPPAPR
jgi:hypothetical protein